MENKCTIKAYNEAVSALFQRFPSFQSHGAKAYKPGLERMVEICRRMGQPQNAYPCVHVAGTNGKGSTCNLLAAQFAARGLRVGLYTSPHILDFRERMRVIGPVSDPVTFSSAAQSSQSSAPLAPSSVELISREEVLSTLQKFQGDFDELELSFFEITTAMAFRFFADRKVDVAVIETGLGGRLDATNIITPKLSIITNIGLDHTDLLGPTLDKIAFEKAGIIKQGVPALVGESHPLTASVFEEVAAQKQAPLYFAENMPITVPDVSQSMDLKGSYQSHNLRTVLAAMKILDLEINLPAIIGAAQICDFHGRWEVVCTQPYTICDIGHNEHGLKYNFAQLEQMLERGEFSDLVMIYGSVADKDVDAVLRILPHKAKLLFTAANSHRAMPAEEIFRRAGREDAEFYPRVPDAVQRAKEICRTLARPLLYIGGSTYVVSEALVELNRFQEL